MHESHWSNGLEPYFWEMKSFGLWVLNPSCFLYSHIFSLLLGSFSLHHASLSPLASQASSTSDHPRLLQVILLSSFFQRSFSAPLASNPPWLLSLATLLNSHCLSANIILLSLSLSLPMWPSPFLTGPRGGKWWWSGPESTNHYLAGGCFPSISASSGAPHHCSPFHRWQHFANKRHVDNHCLMQTTDILVFEVKVFIKY